MAILVGVVDEDHAPGGQGLVEPSILRIGVTIQPRYTASVRLVLLRHPADGPSGVAVPHQGVVIDENVGQTETLDGGDLGPERPVGEGRLQGVTAEYDQHGGLALDGAVPEVSPPARLLSDVRIAGHRARGETPA